MILEGMIAVKAAVLSKHYAIEAVYIDKDKRDHDTAFLIRACNEAQIPVQRVSRREIDGMTTGRTHGGIAASADHRSYQQLPDCLKKPAPFVALAEGVEDPFNLGYLMRALYCAGCDGLILRPRDWSQCEATILKSSAGAAAWLNVVLMDPEEAVSQCRECGLTVYAAMRKNAIPYTEADFRKPVLLCIGGEMRGLSQAVLKQSDQNIYIPYGSDFRNALNASAAAAVLGFEVLRQRSVNDIK